jgi:hypothetical protein
MDQGDFTILACLKENRPKAFCRVPLRADQPRAMTIGVPFGAGGLLSLNKGFGDLEIRWSGFRRKSPCHLPMNVRDRLSVPSCIR